MEDPGLRCFSDPTTPAKSERGRDARGRDMRRELEEWRAAQAAQRVKPRGNAGNAGNGNVTGATADRSRGKENRDANAAPPTPKAAATAPLTPRKQLRPTSPERADGAFRSSSPMPPLRKAVKSASFSAPQMPQSFQCPRKSELHSPGAALLALLDCDATQQLCPAPPNSPRAARMVLGRPCRGPMEPHALAAALMAAFQEAQPEPPPNPHVSELAGSSLAASLEEEEKQLRQEEEELHEQHLQLLDRLKQLQSEAMTTEHNEEVVRDRFAEVTGELQELARRQESQEQRAWKHRVRRHRLSWPVRTAMEMEDHLSRAHDIFNFWFFEMRDRLNSTLRGFQPMEAALQGIPEDEPLDASAPRERPAPHVRQVRRVPHEV